MFASRRNGVALLAPLVALLAVTIAVPVGTFFVYSFFQFELLEPQPGFGFDQYSAALSDATFRRLGWNGLRIAIPTTIASVAAGFALAYYVALCRPRVRTVLLAAIVASMLASYLARIYAWRTLLGQEGVLAGMLRESGVGSGLPEFLLFSRVAVVIGQVNFLLPFTTLVLYAGLSGIAPQLREAGRDLGARPSTVFRLVTLPLAGPALLAATTFTFFLSAGDYLTPILLGGTQGTTLGTAISEQLKLTGNYPLGAALSFLMITGFALVYLAVRVTMRALGLLPPGARGVGT